MILAIVFVFASEGSQLLFDETILSRLFPEDFKLVSHYRLLSLKLAFNILTFFVLRIFRLRIDGVAELLFSYWNYPNQIA